MLVSATHSTCVAKALASAGKKALRLKTPLHTSGHSRALKKATSPSNSSSTMSFGRKAKTLQSKPEANPSAHQHSFGNHGQLDIIQNKSPRLSTRAFFVFRSHHSVASDLCSLESELKYSSSSVIASRRSRRISAVFLTSPPASAFPDPTSSTSTLIRLKGSGI